MDDLHIKLFRLMESSFRRRLFPRLFRSPRVYACPTSSSENRSSSKTGFSPPVIELLQLICESDRLSVEILLRGFRSPPLIFSCCVAIRSSFMGKRDNDHNDPNATVGLRESTAEDRAPSRTELDGETGEPLATIDADAFRTLNIAESNREPIHVDSAANRFSVLRHHASGGLGNVSVARDHQLKRDVALKEIQSRFADDESCRFRFLQEAEVTARLEHPGVVPIYALGKHPDGRPYYAMRFIQGETLCDAISQHFSEARDGAICETSSLRQLLGRFVAVCHAMAYAHSRGVVHRDLKPSNVMLGQVDTIASSNRGLGHWPWGMWKGHDYKDPRTAFGFGRTLVAIDIESGKILWHYRDEEFLDARAVCMNSKNIYCFSGERFLACINAADGQLLWKNDDQELLDAIGSNGRAQGYITGYATTCYMKCNDQYLFFAGPQRKQMVVASAQDGRLAWTHPDGNLQLVLRQDAIYAAGPQSTGVRLDYSTGSRLGTLPTRRACTRATGCLDSVFYRTTGGTVRVMTETNTEQHIAPMRPPCQDGVLVSNGHLYWGPWMCGCQLSLYGNIGLAPAPAAARSPAADPLTVGGENILDVPALNAQPGDWTTYRSDNARSDVTQVSLPAGLQLNWQVQVSPNDFPTAPVAAGNMVFVADRSGAVSAFDTQGKLVWKNLTGGPIYYPPAIAHDRVYVGSADGRVYALAATTGRFLWSYRVAPEDRLIPVYQNLISTWPVAGGVLVHDGSVYAAAGIAHYDGTHVVRLDALTGQPLAINRDSGTLASDVNGGVSMQGDLMIHDGELQFLGGGVYEIARYDLQGLQCLNTPKVQVTSQYRTAFYPYYPEYGKYVSLEHTCEDGSTLCHEASYEGSRFSNLTLEGPLPPGETRTRKELSNWMQRRGKRPPQLWQDKQDRRYTSFIVAGDQLLFAGHADSAPDEAFLAAINIKDGTDRWMEKLPALPVKGGTAIDARGRIYVATEDGQLLCYIPAN